MSSGSALEKKKGRVLPTRSDLRRYFAIEVRRKRAKSHLAGGKRRTILRRKKSESSERRKEVRLSFHTIRAKGGKRKAFSSRIKDGTKKVSAKSPRKKKKEAHSEDWGNRGEGLLAAGKRNHTAKTTGRRGKREGGELSGRHHQERPLFLPRGGGEWGGEASYIKSRACGVLPEGGRGKKLHKRSYIVQRKSKA